MIYVLIGVCGSGKTTIGKSLAEKLKLPFRDADGFHSEENKAKMSQGIPLTDEDRLPWLMSIHRYIKELHSKGESGVVTCSALKKQYRDILIHGRPDSQSETNNTSNVTGHLTSYVKFVLLHGDKAVLRRRMEGRQGHFMPASLLDSQLHVLEIPVVTENCLVVDVDHTVENIVSEILSLTWQKGK